VPYQPGSLAVPPDAEAATNWHSAAALVITALVIFTLAALVTAIATAHAGPIGYQQGWVQQEWAPQPAIQNAQLLPYSPHEHEPLQHFRIGPSASAAKAGA
jgi:hypothetical protein